MTTNGPGWETIVTATPPPCGPCQVRLYKGAIPPADFYVLVRGTTGLFRHECRRCQVLHGDRILVRFVAPTGDIN